MVCGQSLAAMVMGEAYRGFAEYRSTPGYLVRHRWRQIAHIAQNVQEKIYAPLEKLSVAPGLANGRASVIMGGSTLSGDRAMAKGKKSKKKAETVFLVCEETGEYNYSVRRKPGGEKLKLTKYCPKLRKHTVHNEKKK